MLLDKVDEKSGSKTSKGQARPSSTLSRSVKKTRDDWNRIKSGERYRNLNYLGSNTNWRLCFPMEITRNTLWITGELVGRLSMTQ